MARWNEEKEIIHNYYLQLHHKRNVREKYHFKLIL